jgi:nicotinamide mononucleotide (NMN) deamidase PncC
MIDPSRARRIFAGAAASVFAVAATAGMAAGVTAVAAAGVTVARPAVAGPGFRADSKVGQRCFAAGPVRADASSSHARPRCFHA